MTNNSDYEQTVGDAADVQSATDLVSCPHAGKVDACQLLRAPMTIHLRQTAVHHHQTGCGWLMFDRPPRRTKHDHVLRHETVKNTYLYLSYLFSVEDDCPRSLLA